MFLGTPTGGVGGGASVMLRNRRGVGRDVPSQCGGTPYPRRWGGAQRQRAFQRHYLLEIVVVLLSHSQELLVQSEHLAL